MSISLKIHERQFGEIRVRQLQTTIFAGLYTILASISSACQTFSLRILPPQEGAGAIETDQNVTIATPAEQGQVPHLGFAENDHTDD
jgi:hypothetical protein